MSELKQHNSSLDAVRALAILLVLAAHGSFLVTGWLHGHGVPSYWLSAPAGCCGVEIFFCLSGYLIGRVLLDLEAAPSALRLPATRTFLIRRWMRTLPLYYIALDAYLFFPALDPAKQSGSWAYIVFGQN